MTTHTNNKSNPHGVTKAQVGLDNVPNVATNNQTPTFSAASTLATLVSGEKLSVSMGKIMKAISALISHLADNVKHITSAERTKWNGYGTTINELDSNLNTLSSKIGEPGFGLDWANPKTITTTTGGTFYTCEFNGYMYENQTCSTSLTAQLKIDGVMVHSGGKSGTYSYFQTFVKKGQVLHGRGSSGSNVFTYNVTIYPLK